MFDASTNPGLFDAVVSLAPLRTADKAKLRRDAIKAAGGVGYDALLEKERAARKKFRLDNPERFRELRQKHRSMPAPFKMALCANARARGRKRGMGATITTDDLVWPSHCPVLGLELDYPEWTGMRGTQHAQANWPSLDRWDSTKGYVPGNVFVISFRANTLKSSATFDEILMVAKYLSRKPKGAAR